MHRAAEMTIAPTRATNQPTKTGPNGTADAFRNKPTGTPAATAIAIAVGVRQRADVRVLSSVGATILTPTAERTSSQIETLPKIVPRAVRPADLIGFEPRFIKHGPAIGDIVAEIDVRNAALRRALDDRQHVPGTQGAAPLGRVIEEVNCGQGAGQHVHIADTHKPGLKIVAPLLRRKRIVHKGTRVFPRILGRMIRPAFGLGLIAVITIIENQFGARYLRRSNPQAKKVRIRLPNPPLAAVGVKALHDNAQRLASRALPAARPKQHAAEAPPAVYHPLQILRRRDRGHVLVFQLPELVRQVAATTGRRSIAQERFHAES